MWKYIIEPDDIERRKKSPVCEMATNLPFNLEAYLQWNHLALYSKNGEIIKISNVTKREAECIILWAIEVYRWIQAILHEEWLIEL